MCKFYIILQFRKTSYDKDFQTVIMKINQRQGLSSIGFGFHVRVNVTFTGFE